MRLRWTFKAQNQATRSIEYIAEQSVKSAEKVLKDIHEFLDKVREQPYRCAPDKDKLDNNGQYRAFEIHHFRISYKVLQDEIVVLTFRHTSRKPTTY